MVNCDKRINESSLTSACVIKPDIVRNEEISQELILDCITNSESKFPHVTLCFKKPGNRSPNWLSSLSFIPNARLCIMCTGSVQKAGTKIANKE